jgi:hypothetical protein
VNNSILPRKILRARMKYLKFCVCLYAAFMLMLSNSWAVADKDLFQQLPDEMILEIMEKMAQDKDLHPLIEFSQADQRIHRIAQYSSLYPRLASNEICRALTSANTSKNYDNIITLISGIEKGMKFFSPTQNLEIRQKKIQRIHGCVLKFFNGILDDLLLKGEDEKDTSLGHVNLLVALAMSQYPEDIGTELDEKIWKLVHLPSTYFALKTYGGKVQPSILWPILDRFVIYKGKDWILQQIRDLKQIDEETKNSYINLIEKTSDNLSWKIEIFIKRKQGKNRKKRRGQIYRYQLAQWSPIDPKHYHSWVAIKPRSRKGDGPKMVFFYGYHNRTRPPSMDWIGMKKIIY